MNGKAGNVILSSISLSLPRDFTVVGNTVYVIVNGGVSVYVYTYNLTTGANISSYLIRDTDSATRICSYGTNLYITSNIYIYIYALSDLSSSGYSTSQISVGVITYGLYITSSGIIYVGVTGSNVAPIRAYNASDLTALSGFSTATLSNTQIFNLTVSNNIIYAADYANKRISTFNATTGATINLSFITLSYAPFGVDIYGSQLYVQYNGNVYIHDASTGSLLSTFASGIMFRVFSSLGIINGNSIKFYSSTGGSLSCNNITINDHNINIGLGTLHFKVPSSGGHSLYENYDGGFYILSDNGSANGVFLASQTATSWSAQSDKRIKRDIYSIDSVLSKVLKLNPVYFNYIKDASDCKIREGFIAQEVEDLFPTLISSSSYDEEIRDYIKGLCMYDLTPYIVKSIQEQQEIIVSQQSQIDKLTSELAELKTLVRSLSQNP